MTEDQSIDTYIADHISPEPPWLAETYRDTWRYRLYPRMCAGYLQGSVLTMLSAMVAPRRVLEIGTYSGYSAMALAAGMASDGVLHTVEIDDEHENFIRRQLARFPFADRIVLHIGDALSVVPSLSSEPWDMVYIDANKRSYIDYYEMVVPLMAPGAFMLVDNTLWDGKVALDVAMQDPQCKAIDRFNSHVAADPRVMVAMIPLRDGLTLIRKLPENVKNKQPL